MCHNWDALKGLKQSETLIYFYIYEYGIKPIETISKETKITKPNVKSAIEKLEKLGLITRKEEKSLQPNKPIIPVKMASEDIQRKLSGDRFGSQALKKMKGLGLEIDDQKVINTILNYDISQVLYVLNEMEGRWLEIRNHVAYFCKQVPNAPKEILDGYPRSANFQEPSKLVELFMNQPPTPLSLEARKEAWKKLGRPDRARKIV